MCHVCHVLETLESRLLLDSHPVIDIAGEIEPNDTRETATVLPESPFQPLRPCFLNAAGIADCPPTLYSGHGVLADLESPADSTDVDFWSIQLASGNSINLLMQGSAATLGVLPELQDADGQVVAHSKAHDDNGDGTPDSTGLEFIAEAGGVFYIQLGPGGGRYALHAAVHGERHIPPDPHVEHEPNDTFDTAQEIPLLWLSAAWADESVAWQSPKAFGVVRGNLENGEVSPDTDFYRFSVGPELTIDVSASGVGAQGGHLTVYDQQQNIIAEAEPNADGMLATTFESTYEGQYFIQLTDTGSVVCITTPCLTYELKITARHEFVDPHVEQEPNNDFASANPIELHPNNWWPCDFVCPLADATGVESELAEPAATGDQLPVNSEVWWPDDQTLRGFVHGELEVVGHGEGPSICSSPDANGNVTCTTDIIPYTYLGTDFFTFDAPHGRDIHIELTGGLADSGGLIALFDEHQRGLVMDADPTDGVSIDWSTAAGGVFFIEVFSLPVGPECSLVGVYTATPGVQELRSICSPRASSQIEENTTLYMLHVRIGSETPQPDPHREHEPNDTLEMANEIELLPPLWWPCEFDVCPLADEMDATTEPTEADVTAEARAGNMGLRPIPWPGDRKLTGFVTGELERVSHFGPSECDPPNEFGNMRCTRDFTEYAVPGVDFFTFNVPAGSEMQVRLTGDLAESFGQITLISGDHKELASDADLSDGLALTWTATAEGDFFVKVHPQAVCTMSANLATRCDGQSTQYTLSVVVNAAMNAIEGPDEHEPNDTMEQPNEIELPRVGDVVCLAIGCPPATLPGEHARHGVVRGIAGGPTHDVDYFSFHVFAGEQVSVGLGEVLRHEIEPLVNAIDAVPDSQPPLFVTVFDADGNEIGRTDGDSLKRILFESELGGVYFARVELQPDAPDAEVADYRLHIHASKFSHEGPDESEPNDTFDQADPIELVTLPTFAPGIELRGGDARGIAGGPSHDADVFSFEVKTSEHVTVGVTGFGRSLGACPDGFASNGTECVQACLAPSPLCDERMPLFVYDRPIHVSVFDAEGNPVGESDGSDGHPHAVSLDADTAGQYFAVVSVSPDTDALVRYRLGVLARLTLEPDELPIDEKPLEIVLRHGQSFRYVDADGDAVHIVFQGRGSAAHIMFDGAESDGSDIVSVDIAGVRRGGNFRVQTTGSAEVGSLEIQGFAARSRRSGSFGNVSIDGNLGSFSSSLNLRSLAIDGILGEVYAPGRQIGQVSAMVFDHAMADVGSIRSLRIEEEMSSAIFELFLPDEEQP